jgi:glutathione S-transferase/GST-like protein
MFTLYCRNSAGSMAPEALLAACGAEYKVIVLERRPDGSFHDFFLKINPKAEVPTLMLPDDSVMTESAAMMIHIADLFPAAGFAPAPGSPERAQFLRWQVYLATTLYMSELRMFYPDRYTADTAGAEAVKTRATEMMAREFAIYAEALGTRPFILGNRMSAPDIYAAMLCTWVPDMAALFAAHPNLARNYEAVLANPKIRAVWTRNGL